MHELVINSESDRYVMFLYLVVEEGYAVKTSAEPDFIGLVYVCGCLLEFAINNCFGDIVKCIECPTLFTQCAIRCTNLLSVVTT